MNEGKSCSTTACSTSQCCPKKFLFTALATFALTFAFDFVVHGNLLMAQYEATASLWRPQPEMEAMMGYCIGKHAIQALVFAALFMCWNKNQTFGACFTAQCPVRKGFKFGALLGLFIGVESAAAYIWIPMPRDLALNWLVAETVKWGLVGGILALLCHRCSKKA